MLSFDPRALLTPGGVINGAGNAIAALAGVPARYQQVKQMERQNSLAQQALQEKDAVAQQELGLKKRGLDQTDAMNGATIAHLGRQDANMLSPEQRMEMARIRAQGSQHQASPWKMHMNPITGNTMMVNEQTGETYQMPLGAQGKGGFQTVPGGPAVHALGGAPQVQRMGAAGTGVDPTARIDELNEKLANGTATDADAAELERLVGGQ